MKRKIKTLSLVLALILSLSALAIFPATASAATGWDGSQSVKPIGSGTENDPYLIATAANLRWMRDQVYDASSAAYKPDGEKYHLKEELGMLFGVFEGKYFKQIADIDLNAKTLNSIGYYTNFTANTDEGNDRRINAFAGVYDGNGYSIKNGTISSSNKTHALNPFWGNGLFGVIYGATIKNLTLDNLAVEGWGITGALVGISLYHSTATEGSRDDKSNTIYNCHVKNTTVTVNNPGENTNSNEYTASGAMIGYAFGCDISYCTCDADITAPGNFRRLGGIAGLAGADTVIDHCVFTGSITLDVDTVANSLESGYGGIVGSVMPAGIGSVNCSTTGVLKITDCYNSGTFAVDGTAADQTICYGGILGSSNVLIYVAEDAQDPYPYLIENCYNLFEATTNSMNFDTTSRRTGGIVGSSWHTGGATASTLYLKDCTSVTVDAVGYDGNNEYRTSPNLSSAATGSKNGATVVDGSVPNLADHNTATILTETDKIDAAIVAKAILHEDAEVYDVAIKPIGAGTEYAPYLVESAANLNWIREQVADKKPMSGEYFLQINDIDLEGKAIYPIGASTLAPFKGIYDGQGFSVKNGVITTSVKDNDFNLTFGTGLFGVIQTAKVHSVVLDGVTVDGYGVTGGIVGIAYATGANSKNSIQNCIVKSTCVIQARNPIGSESETSSFHGPGNMGGIVGMAYATSIEACVNEAHVIAFGAFSHGAGIAGTAGAGTAIRNCANKGSLLFDHSQYAMAGEAGWGGIVGFCYPYAGNSPKGDLTIESCYNSGAMYQVGLPVTAVFYWGGIIGGFNALPAGYTYKISHCYNTNDKNYIDISGTGRRVGGLVGVYWTNEGAQYAPVKIDNSYSVQITEGGNLSTYYGTNEYRAWLQRKVEGNLPCISIMLADGTYGLGLESATVNATYLPGVTVGTKTASELTGYLTAIDTAITAAQTAAYHGAPLITYYGYQSTVPANGKVDIRLVFGVDIDGANLHDWSNIHVYAIGNSDDVGLDTQVLYTSVRGTKANGDTVLYHSNAYTGSGSGATEVVAINHNYLATLTIGNVPTTSSYTLRVVGVISPNVSGAAYEFSAIEITITNGVAA